MAVVRSKKQVFKVFESQQRTANTKQGANGRTVVFVRLNLTVLPITSMNGRSCSSLGNIPLRNISVPEIAIRERLVSKNNVYCDQNAKSLVLVRTE